MSKEDRYLIFLDVLTEKLQFKWEVSEGTNNGIKCQFYSWQYWGEDDFYCERDFIESLEELVEDVLEEFRISLEVR